MKDLLKLLLVQVILSLPFASIGTSRGSNFPPPCTLSVNAGPDKMICSGSSAQVNIQVTGNTGSYTTSWTPSGTGTSPVFNPSSTTTYTVTVTNGSCTASDAVVIYVVPNDELVANGSFESSTSPQLRGQIENASPWKKGTGDADLFDVDYTLCGINTNLATLDLCSVSPVDFNCIGIPCNHFGYQDVRKPYTKFYAGLGARAEITSAAMTVGISKAVEAIEIPLLDILDTTQTYRLSFYVSRAEKGEIDTLLTSPYAKFNVKMSTGFVSDVTYQPLPATVIASGTVSDTMNWQRVSITFKPADTYGFLIIESDIDAIMLESALSTNINVNHEYPYTLQSYFYIDDISLKFLCESDTSIIAIAGNDKYICKGDSVTIGGMPVVAGGTPPYSYYWSPPGMVTDPYIANPKAFPNVTTTFTLTVTDANGLTATDQMTVYVSNMFYDAGPPSYTVCSGTSTQIGTIPYGGIPPYTYTWSPNTGMTPASADVAQPSVSPNSNTLYKVTVTDTAGCVRKDSIQFTVIQSPTVNAGTDKIICEGSSTTLTGSTSGGLSPYINGWYTTSGTLVAEGTTASVSPSTTTNYVFTSEDARGCFGRDTVKVTVNPKPIISGSDAEICEKDSALIGPTATGGYAYSWSTGATTSQIKVSPPLNPDPDQPYYYYTLTVTNPATGCTNSKLFIVKVNPLPTANANVDRYICLGGSTKIGGKHTGSGEGGFTYVWAPGTGLNSTTSAIPTANPTSTTTYIVTVTNSNNCKAKDTVVVNVILTCTGGGDLGPGGTSHCGGVPEADAGEDVYVCKGSSPTIGSSPTANFGTAPYTYKWTPATGLSSDTVPNPTVTNVGRKAYKLFITDACGRTSQDIVTVTMKKPTVSAGSDKTVCAAKEAVIGTTPSGGYPGYTVSWTASTGATPAPTTPTSVYPTTTTTYILRLNDTKGCTATDTVVVFVNPTPTVNAGPDTMICLPGDSVIIGGFATGGTPTYNYVWYPTRGLSATTIAKPKTKPFVATNYRVTVTDNKGCTATDQILVKIFESPYLNAGPDITICKNFPDSIGNTALLGLAPYTYSWSPSTNLGNSSAPRTTANPPTTTTYTETVTDANGCKASDAVIVNVKPTPEANAGPDLAICQGDCDTIGVAATGGAPPLTYSWYPAYGLAGATNISPKACPDQTTIYVVTVTGANQCYDTDTMELQVFPTPELVMNGDFEFGNVPTGRGDIEAAYPWADATGDPDLFDQYYTTCGSIIPQLPTPCGLSPLDYNCVGVPCNHFGYQEHRLIDGRRYAGLWSALGLHVNGTYALDPNTSFTADGTFAVEGMEIKLEQALVPGRTYELSFWVNMADKVETGNNLPPTLPQLGTDSILQANWAPLTVKFSKDFATQTLYRPVDRPVQFAAVVNDSVNWVHMYTTFTPTEAYEYLIIESDPAAYKGLAFSGYQNKLAVNTFIGTGATVLINYPASIGLSNNIDVNQPLKPFYNLQSYLYVDDISLQEYCNGTPPLIVDAGPDTSMCSGNCYTLGGDPTASYGTPGYTYSWTSNPPGFTSSLANPNVCPTTTTQYTLTVYDAGTQVKSDAVLVTIVTPSELVPNRDFEAGDPPAVRGDIEKAYPWFKGTGDADLYDAVIDCGALACDLGGNVNPSLNCIDVPCNHFGYQDVNIAGQRYGGLWSLIQLNGDVKTDAGGPVVVLDGLGSTGGGKVPITLTEQIAVEAIEVKLDETLVVDRFYKLSFYISKAERGETGENIQKLPSASPTMIDTKNILVDECAGYHVKLSTDSVTNILFQPIDRAPIASGTVCDTTNWELKTVVFKATQPVNYLIIESYPTDGARYRLAQNATRLPSPDDVETPYASGFQSYFYIDDVSLTEYCGESYSLTQQNRPIATEQKVLGTLGMGEVIPSISMQVVPNPNKGSFSIAYKLEAGNEHQPEFVFYDAVGKVVSQFKPEHQLGKTDQTFEFNLKNSTEQIVPGLYFVRLIQGNKSIVKKISVIP